MHVVLALFTIVAVASATCPARTDTIPIAMQALSADFSSPIGIDEHEPTNTVLVSVHYSSGQPYNFARLDNDGNKQQFTSISGYTNEVKIATVKSGAVNMGGFIAGQMYVGTGVNGQIARVDPTGTTVDTNWASLGSVGLFRGSLYHDRTGVWDGDLIAVTTSGQVWRVNSAGQGTFLDNVGTHLEGLVVLPNTAEWGPFAGAIMAGAEGQGKVYVFRKAEGGVQRTVLDLSFEVEDLDIIPERGNFFGVDYGNRRILGAGFEQWDGLAGKVLAVQEFHRNHLPGLPLIAGVIGWSGDCSANSGFYFRPLANAGGDAPAQWEHVTFAAAGLAEIPTVPENDPCEPGPYPTQDASGTVSDDDNSVCMAFNAEGEAVPCDELN